MRNLKRKLKKQLANIAKIIKDNLKLAALLLIILTVLVVGSFTIGFVKTLIILGLFSTAAYLYFFKPRQRQEKMPSHKKTRKKVRNIFFILFLLLSIAIVVAVGVFGYYIVKSAPAFEEEKLYTQETSIMYDSENEIMAKLGRERRQKITFDQLPQVLIDAVIATEDSRYFQHNGFDLPRFTKASVGQLMGDSGAGGGSTIAMQVVKNTLTSSDQNIIRKFTDIYLAVFVLEKKYTKEEIFELYVNIPFLGANSYGVEEASQTYFGKSVSQLTLSEAALIAGLFQSPSVYNPYSNPKAASDRRSTVLYLMRIHGYISKDEEQLAKSIPVEDLLLKNRKAPGEASPYQAYIDYVVKEVQEKTGTNPYDSAMEIYTTFNRKKQEALNTSVEKSSFPNDFTQTGIAVTETQTGAIVALFGGRHKEGERTFNYATDMSKQIGSSAKPIYDYGPAVEYANWNEATMVKDEPWTYSDGVRIKNWDNKFMGEMNVKRALGISRNIPALKAFQAVGNKKSMEFALNLGMSPEVENGVIYETHALGGYTGESPLSMTAAYAAFGNGGKYIKPYAITKIIFKNSGKEEVYKPLIKQAMSDSTAFIITDILVWSVNSGLSSNARVSGVQVAAKTGTSNYDSATLRAHGLPGNAVNDLWLIAYSPTYSVGIWYGYDEISKKHYNRSGDNRDLVRKVSAAMFTDKGTKFETPKSVKKVSIELGSDPISLPSPFTPKDRIYSAWFKVGTEPTDISPKYNALSSVSNLEGTIVNNKVTLTWDHTISKELSDYLKNNGSSVGTIGYNVYRLGNNDNMTLLGYTNNKNFTINDVASKTTYIVTSTYSLARTTESIGVMVTVTPPTFTLNLNGSGTVNVAQFSIFEDTSPAVLVKDLNGDSIEPGNYLLERTIRNTSTNEYITLATITDEKGTYEITYKVTYAGVPLSTKRTVIVN